MIRMAAPYTGIVHSVDDSKVAARLAAGYRLIDTMPEKTKKEEAEELAELPPLPSRDSTIAEIRAYAKAAGIDLPKGNKADLLEALGVE